jgi:hypothetical protein
MGVKQVALLIVLVIASTGCDKLFDLDHLDPADGGTGDGGVGDAKLVDAPPCNPIGHDEDGDLLDDACDACPTFGPGSLADADGDGLTNSCDRDNAESKSDRILAYWSFATDNLTDFTYTANKVYDSSNNGMYNFSPANTVRTKASYPLTRVDFHIAGITMQDFSSQLSIQIGAITYCTYRGAACGGTGPGTCQAFNTTSSTWPMQPSAATHISMYRDGSVVRCAISSGDGSNAAPVGVIQQMPTGSVGFVTNSSTSILVTAIVIYGAN